MHIVPGIAILIGGWFNSESYLAYIESTKYNYCIACMGLDNVPFNPHHF